ncbi:MAG TPA: hypothetical protein VGK59_17745, partial [Ohtaekwangia sp.]
VLFFSLDYRDESKNEFRKLLQSIDSLCISGNEAVIGKFILLSQFVDGYFAEDYFNSADQLCRRESKVFCKVFKSIDVAKKQRLIAHGINCKK